VFGPGPRHHQWQDALMAFMSQHGDASVVRLAAKEARRQEEERCREEARRLREEQDQGLGPLGG